MSLINDYFIIESLKQDDIKDGTILYDGLKSTGKYNPVYKKVQTKKAFEKALFEFSISNYKYLFISAHGDEENITLIKGSYNAYDLDELEINLTRRRIFMSTCNGGTFLIAKYFIKKGAYSLIGTPDRLLQIVATSMWITMILVFEQLNEDSINFKELDETIKLMAKVYQINLAYYSFVRDEPRMKEYLYAPNKRLPRKNYPL